MAPDPLRFLESTDASNAADSAAVAELVAVFDSSRLTRSGMSLSDLLDLYHTIRDLEKCIKTVRPIVAQGNFDGLWAKARGAGVVVSAQTLTLRDLFRFREWVISPSGQASLCAFQHENNNKKKHSLGKAVAMKGNSEQERRMALLRLFAAQKQDRAALIAVARAERDEKVARLRRKIEKANKAHEEAMARIREKYPVPSGYAAPDAAFVHEQCWNMHVAECQAEGKPTGVKSARDLEEKYGQVVRDRHLLAYLRRPEVKEALLAYGREKLLALRDEGNSRVFASFRGILEIASGGSVSPLPEITPAPPGKDSEEVAKPLQTSTLKGNGSNRKRKHTSALPLLATNTLKKRGAK